MDAALRARDAGEFTSEDVEYLSHDGRPLLGRLYTPTSAGPHPAVVCVHGGAWTSGDRLQYEPTCQFLAANGILMFSVDFRQPPVAAYPAPVADIHFAVRWLKENAAKYGASPDIGGLGFSSGGHQLMLAALRPHEPAYSSIPSASETTDATLAFAVLCYAVLDPLARYEMAVANGQQNLIDSHHAYWPSTGDMSEGNPQNVVEWGTAEDLPRLLIIQGLEDGNLPTDTARRFAAAYGAAGGSAELLEYDDSPHGFVRRKDSHAAADDARANILRFVLGAGQTH
jgi:acetyl esterase